MQCKGQTMINKTLHQKTRLSNTNPTKTGVNSDTSIRKVSSSCSTSDTRRVTCVIKSYDESYGKVVDNSPPPLPFYHYLLKSTFVSFIDGLWCLTPLTNYYKSTLQFPHTNNVRIVYTSSCL